MAAPASLAQRIRLPTSGHAPGRAVLRRIGFAISLVIFVALVVRLGRGGYVDVTGDEIGFLDAVYYASVTVTTTGYGDITAVSDGARLATILLITPARILFLILVVGTTVEVLTDQSRRLLLTRRWRQRVRDHIIICGYGSTGQSAAEELVSRGADRGDIAVVDLDPKTVDVATRQGFVGIVGDATHREVLVLAGVANARSIIVTPARDDTAVLITLTARELNPTARIVAGGRERENLHLLRQGGADEVIDETAAVGRMVGLATESPEASQVLDDLINGGHGLELVDVAPIDTERGPIPPAGCTVVAVFRNGRRLDLDDETRDALRVGDRLIVLRTSPNGGEDGDEA